MSFSKDLGASPVHRFMVVDDDPISQRLVQARLRARGYEVDAVGSGEEALEKIEDFRPDLVFLDVSMPGIDGLEVLERMRGRGLDLAVIMMTAFGTEEVAVEALRRGADDYLRKPFEQIEFQTVLDRTVRRLELGRQNEVLRSQLDEKRRQLEAELARAGRVQAELLPSTAPEIEGFELAARCVPAREIGGDFYGWTESGENDLTLTLGDVMGKGMPAALLMATARAVLHALARQNPPGATMNLAARSLGGDLQRSGSFVTLFHAQLDAARRHVSYVDAGHGHVFVKRSDGRTEQLAERGLPLGILPEETYEEGSVGLGPGDVLVAYSDGLVEASPGKMLGTGDLARELDGATSAREMVERLVRMSTTAGPPPDDLTVMVLRCHEND